MTAPRKSTSLRNTLIILGILPFLSSCQTTRPSLPSSADQIQAELKRSIQQNQALAKRSSPAVPRNITSSLIPPLSGYINNEEESDKEPKFDVQVNKVPAKEFFMGLVANTKYNIVVSPKITGTVSLDLKNVTVRQAMEAARSIYGYEYQPTSYGYRVTPPQLETQLFHINYLDLQRTGKSLTMLTTGEVTNAGTINAGAANNLGNNLGGPNGNRPMGQQGNGTTSTIETKTEAQFWKNIEKTILNITGKGKGRTVTVNAQAGVISVQAYPIELQHVANFINSLQSSLNRQVIIEAKILEVTLNDDYQGGIDWAMLANPAAINPLTQTPFTGGGIGQAATKLFSNTDLDEMNGGMFAVRLNGNFKLLINLLQSQGNVQVLSSPHISTINNQKAVIKVGQDEFFVTGVSTTNSIIGTSTLPSQDVSLTPFFSGVTLDVTPEISNKNNIILHIHPSISRVKEQTKVVGLGTSSAGNANNLTLPLAFSTIRESDTVVRAKNKQVIVIGGLMENTMSETVAGTPWLSKIPFLGSLFRRTQQNSNKTEFVILLRPIIANNKEEIRRLKQNKQSFQMVKRPFMTGGLPKVFGNEGERANNF